MNIATYTISITILFNVMKVNPVHYTSYRYNYYLLLLLL